MKIAIFCVTYNSYNELTNYLSSIDVASKMAVETISVDVFIADNTEKDYAVININNMIPVPMSQVIEIDINKEKNASYKYLLQAESREINRQKNRIRKNAEIVYSHKIHNGNTTPLAKRTNDFVLLEKLCKEY